MKILLILALMAVACGGAFHTYHARSQYIDAALLAEAFTLAAPLKMRITEHYLQNGTLPRSNEDAGLGAPNSIFGTSVKRITVNQNGALQVDFDEEIGRIAMLFSPSVETNDGKFSWRCTSDTIDSAVLEKLRPVCHYESISSEPQLMGARANNSPDPANVGTESTGTAPNSIVEEKRLRSLYVELRSAASICHTRRISSLLIDEKEFIQDGMVAGKPLILHVTKPECSVALLKYVQGFAVYNKALQARLTHATRQCRSADVLTLLYENPGIDALYWNNKRTSLFDEAAFSGCSELVSTLIREKSLEGKFSAELLSEVIRRAPQDALVQLTSKLVASGADVNAVSEAGETPLSTAIASGQPVIAKFLIDAGADVNAETLGGSYPLIEATKKGYTQLVSQLLLQDAEIDKSDALGRTAIIVAVAQNKIRLVDTLLRAGANPYLRDNDGISAFVLAENAGQRTVQSMITSSASN